MKCICSAYRYFDHVRFHHYVHFFIHRVVGKCGRFTIVDRHHRIIIIMMRMRVREFMYVGEKPAQSLSDIITLCAWFRGWKM